MTPDRDFEVRTQPAPLPENTYSNVGEGARDMGHPPRFDRLVLAGRGMSGRQYARDWEGMWRNTGSMDIRIVIGSRGVGRGANSRGKRQRNALAGHRSGTMR